jgi:tRNA-specific 2-thiouridylase
MRRFLDNHLEYTAGDIILENGEKIGEHKAIQSLTIGQRRGLNTPYKYPIYVLSVDLDEKIVTVGPKESLARREYTVSSVNWTGPEPQLPKRVTVKNRNTHPGQFATIEYIENQSFEDENQIENDVRIKITLDKPDYGVSPGQSAVFYCDHVLLGGGIVDKHLTER